MHTLLIIDDEANVLYSLQASLRSDKTRFVTAQTAREGLDLLSRESPDVVLLDVRLPDMSGLEAYLRIREFDARLPVIIMTAHGTTETAIEAMKRGAFDYLIKPVELAELRATVARALDLSRLSRVPAAVADTSSAHQAGDLIVGRSRVMQEVYKQIGRVTAQVVNVLILGESGTGKELVARAIVQHSQRADKPFLAINCAAIPETLLESELFGHERGAFTGAERQRLGKFEQANGGSLFLDEIGDMSVATQSKVLRLLQEQRFERVGGSDVIQTDVRLIAATHQDLLALVESNRFRQDLFYRLNVFTIRLPALRERMEDLPDLVDYFLRRFSRELNKPITLVAPAAMECLQAHDWPGNIRELENAIKYAIVQARSDIVTKDCLPAALIAAPVSEPEVSAVPIAPGITELDVAQLTRQLLEEKHPSAYSAVIAEVDRVILREALDRAKGQQMAAAEMLGMARNTLRAKLRMLGMSVEKQLKSDGEDG